MALETTDRIAFAAFAGWGLWWIVAPRSDLAFYRWFHRGTTRAFPVRGVRLAGVIWVIVVAGVFWSVFWHTQRGG